MQKINNNYHHQWSQYMITLWSCEAVTSSVKNLLYESPISNWFRVAPLRLYSIGSRTVAQAFSAQTGRVCCAVGWCVSGGTVRYQWDSIFQQTKKIVKISNWNSTTWISYFHLWYCTVTYDRTIDHSSDSTIVYSKTVYFPYIRYRHRIYIWV